MSVVAELSKRNVLRVGTAYLVAAWPIVQVSETLFPLFGFGDRPVQIVVIALAIGFVPVLVLVLARAFRLTPEGVRREADIDLPLSARATRRLDRLIMAVLALGVFAFDRFVLESQRDAVRQEQVVNKVEEARLRGRTEALQGLYGDKSIVVLPFVNMSEDAGNEFFSDGISDRGKTDAAFEWLDRAVAYGNLRSDPRWSPFLESIGRARAQLDTIAFEVRRPR